MKKQKKHRNVGVFDFENPQYNPDIKDYHRPNLIIGMKLFSNEQVKFIEIWDFLDGAKEQGPIVIYFHNLSYDGSSIMFYFKKTMQLFTNITNGMNKTYKIQHENIEFRCTLCLFNTSCEELGESLTNILGYKFCKGDGNHEDTRRGTGEEMPQEFFDYCKRDVEIIKITLEQFGPLLTDSRNPLPRLTIGSGARQQFVNMLGGQNKGRDLFPKGYPEYEGDKTNLASVNEGYAKEIEPGENSGHGGLCIYNNDYHNRFVKGEIHKYDINSSYPASMLDLLPLGERSDKPGPHVPNICFVHIYVSKVTLKPGHCPCFPTGFRASDTNESGVYNQKIIPRFIIMGEEELDFLKKHNDIEYRVVTKYYFRAGKYGKPFVDKFKTMKETTGGAQRMFAKYMLNCAYGKLGESMRKVTKVLDDNMIDNTYYPYKTETTFNLNDKAYLPAALVIAARSRMRLVEAASKDGSRVMYMDTDCIVSYGDYSMHLDIDPNKFGAGKGESDPNRGLTINEFKVIKPKCYAYNDKDGGHFVISGVPKKARIGLTVDQFHIGKLLYKFQNDRTKGYNCLTKTNYMI